MIEHANRKLVLYQRPEVVNGVLALRIRDDCHSNNDDKICYWPNLMTPKNDNKLVVGIITSKLDNKLVK